MFSVVSYGNDFSLLLFSTGADSVLLMLMVGVLLVSVVALKQRTERIVFEWYKLI